MSEYAFVIFNEKREILGVAHDLEVVKRSWVISYEATDRHPTMVRTDQGRWDVMHGDRFVGSVEKHRVMREADHL